MNSTDKRFQKTENDILKAEIKLLKKNGNDFSNITKICKTAKISRSAFYLHFKNTEAVVDRLINNAVTDYLHDLKEAIFSSDKGELFIDILWNFEIKSELAWAFKKMGYANRIIVQAFKNILDGFLDVNPGLNVEEVIMMTTFYGSAHNGILNNLNERGLPHNYRFEFFTDLIKKGYPLLASVEVSEKMKKYIIEKF